MIAGATTHARTAIGTVTEAQIPRIFASEYCAELSAAPTGAGSDCVVVMGSASASGLGQHIASQARLRSSRVRREGDARVHLGGDARSAREPYLGGVAKNAAQRTRVVDALVAVG